MTNISAVIPARLGSTRLPGKVLLDIHGKPLLWHVWQQVRQARQVEAVYVATDAREVCQAVEAWGGQVLLTSPDCQSGTERIASVIDQIPGDLILNVQGDEPMLDPLMLDQLVEAWRENRADVVTPVYPIDLAEELANPNIVKVARAGSGRALYFSRSPIPYVRDLPPERWGERGVHWGHIGVYAYRREVLDTYTSLPPSSLENTERLEQLRLLEAGYRIDTIETHYRSIAVDTFADLERVRQKMV